MTPSDARTILDYYRMHRDDHRSVDIGDPDATALTGSDVVFVRNADVQEFRRRGISLGSIIKDRALLIHEEDWTAEPVGQQSVPERFPELLMEEVGHHVVDGAAFRLHRILGVDGRYSDEAVGEALSVQLNNLALRLDLGIVASKAERSQPMGRTA